MKRTFTILVALSALLAGESRLAATKPCEAPPCRKPGGELDRGKCAELADWIAVGRIEKVVHHQEGHPTLRDFAEFTLHVERWEKATASHPTDIRFKVGWCQNMQTLPADTSGQFRFYGKAFGPAAEAENQYLDFEAVKPDRPAER